MRNKYLWAPLYAFLIVKVILLYKRYAYVILLSAVLCFSVTDFFSSSVIKPLTERVRPCNNSQLAAVQIKAPCRQSFSFVSAHASNHMAIAIFFFLLFKRSERRWPYLLILWAVLIGIAQIYVGLHYPFDVLCGAIIGLAIGFMSFMVLNKWYMKPFNVNPS